MTGENSMQGRVRVRNAGRVMNSYRLTNTHHTEIVNCLPLPSLPIHYGASTSELRLHDHDGSAVTPRELHDANLAAHSGKIVELLRGTDVSYLCLREDLRDPPSPVQTGFNNLEAAVLRIDPEAFSYTTPGPIHRKGSRISAAEKKDVSQTGSWLSRSLAGTPPQVPQPLQHSGSSLDGQAVPTTRKLRMSRKDNIRLGETEQGEQKFTASLRQHEDVVSSFCGLLDELFEHTDAPGEDEGEEAGTFVSLSEIKGLVEEIVKVRAKISLQILPLDYLLKLLTLLDRHVHRAFEKEVDEFDDVDSENTLVVLSALEAVHASLTIMTDRGLPRQVYNEEIMDRIVEFTRYQIVHSIFPAYDPVYRQLHKSSIGEKDEDLEDLDEDMEDHAAGSMKKGRKKVKSGKARRMGTTKVSSGVSNVLQKLCSILALLRDLLSVERLPDSTVLQLTKTVLATFGVDNVQLLQIKAIGVACSVFSLYAEHRSVIIEECVAMFWKLSSSKRNIRTYSLPDEEPKNIQMLSSLVLQLVQCSVNLPAVDAETDAVIEAGPSFSTKSFDPAMDACKNFWKLVLQRWAAPKSQDSVDVKGIVENIVVDLLITLNAPEFPAASLLLQILCILLFGTAGLKSKDAGVRGAAIELLGLIAARLKQDAVTCSKDSLWILSQLTDKFAKEPSVRSTNLSCVVCLGTEKGVKSMVACAGCERMFHGICIGVGGHDFLCRGWLCCCCLCRRQLASFASESKACAAGHVNPSIDKPENDEGESNNHTNIFGSFSTDGTAVLQQLLLNYLLEAAQSDSSAAYARRFYLCQWYRDGAQGLENLMYHLNRLVAKPPLQDFGVTPAPLPRDIITRLSTALGQLRPLAKGFDRILERLLASLQESSPGPRAKALRAVSALVEVDPSVLGDERVRLVVEGRFLDSAISVREAAMELVGRHIVRLPHLAEKYFDKLVERIMDTGVSVRKRVIKIIRDLCVANVGFAKSTDACVRIISRINDDETSIQDLVGKTFYELWFEEPAGQHFHCSGDGTTVPAEIVNRTQQLVDVLKSLPTHQPMVTVIKRSLALDFAPQAVKNPTTIALSQGAVRTRCELMCKCLLESILKADESTTEDAEIRAFPYVLALQAFCTVDPTLCAPASDPSRFAVTLAPYLKTQVDNQGVAQLLQSIVYVVNTVLPMLRRPPQIFVEELVKDLKLLIERYLYRKVINACIKCLCSVSKITAKAGDEYKELVQKGFKFLEKRNKEVVGTEKASIQRNLYCLGQLCRYGSGLVDSMEKEGISMEKVFNLLRDYLRSPEHDVKWKALQAVGDFFIARPDFMMKEKTEKILRASLCDSADYRLKLQTLQNFCEYLSTVEDQMGVNEGKDKKTSHRGDVSTAVPVAAGAGENNIAGSIIQFHWELILRRCLDNDDQVRLNALKVLDIALRQGLVHPMSCVAQLVALEVDQQELISKLAHQQLVIMNEKYPHFLESRLGDGLQLSFEFIESGAAASKQRAHSRNASNISKVNGDVSAAVSAKAGIARVYKLIKNNRVARHNFLFSIIKKYDFTASGSSIVSFLLYCAEVLAALPFTLPDEPLFVVHSINRILQVRGGVLEANIKAAISEGPLASRATKIVEVLAAERVQEGIDAYNFNAVNQSRSRVIFEDDTAGIPEEAVTRLKDDCHSAIALALLLRLKRHIKIMYSLSDARCQAYLPHEQMKQGETVQKKESMKELSTKELPVKPPATIRQMLEQYQAFKRLLKEDAMDYSEYVATNTKKRGRGSHAEAATGQAHTMKTSRKKEGTLGAGDGDADGEVEGDDEDDEDWTEKKRKSGNARSRSRSRKSGVAQ